MQETSVVCVTYNNETTIANLMQSLTKQGGAVRELVIVDNGSSDGTIDAIRSQIAASTFDVSLIEGQNVGFAAGIDSGLQALRWPRHPILVVNPDVCMAAGIITKMLMLLTSIPEAAIVTAPLQLPSGIDDPASRRKLPKLGSSSVYAALGKFTPDCLRYNGRQDSHTCVDLATGYRYTAIEATTGALMLVSPTFRNVETGIFDLSYWMYGEDLQLCTEVQLEGRLIVLLEESGCLHVKGVSSGLPRSKVADQAFHRALYVYYAKNLRHNSTEAFIVMCAIGVRYGLSRTLALLSWSTCHDS